MIRPNLMFALIPLALACGEKEVIDSAADDSAADDSASDDTAADDTASDDTAADDTATDDTAEEERANMTLTLRDVLSSDPIPGVTVVADGEAHTSDAEGLVEFSLLRGTSHTFVSSIEGYLDSHSHVVIDEHGLRGSEYMLSEQTIAALSAALGIAVDPEKAIVHVLVSDVRASPYSTLPGTTLDLTVAYGAVLVADGNSPYQVSPGNTSQEDVRSSFYFVNVEPGPLSLTMTPADGLSCEWGLGGTAFGDWQPEVVANAFNNLQVHCE